MKASHSSFLPISIGAIIVLIFVNFLGGCGRSDDNRRDKGSDERAPVVKDLGWCCKNGDLDGVKAFLTTHNINGVEGQRPPLHLAASGGHLDVVEFLINQGADINRGDGYGYYPIHVAAVHGRLDVIKLLLAAGAKADQESGVPYSDTQLMEIASEIRGFSASDKFQPIHSAAKANQPEVVKFFIGLGISPDTKDGTGNNVLDYALRPYGWCQNRAKLIRLLDQDGSIERKSMECISTEGYYVTDESTPTYIRFMPEELDSYEGSNEVFPRRIAVVSFGPKGGTTPGEIPKWLHPKNKEAAKQGGFITGYYKLMGSSVSFESFNSDQEIGFSSEGKQLKIYIRSMQQVFFPEPGGSGNVWPCKFVSWK